MGKMSLTSCRALSTPGKFSNVDRYEPTPGVNPWSVLVSMSKSGFVLSHSPKLSDSLHGRGFFLIFPNPLLKASPKIGTV